MHGHTDAQTDAHMHDGHRAMTLARWPTASGTKNNMPDLPLKTRGP